MTAPDTAQKQGGQLPWQPCGQRHSRGRPCGACDKQNAREREALQRLLLEMDGTLRDPAEVLWGASRVLLILREVPDGT